MCVQITIVVYILSIFPQRQCWPNQFPGEFDKIIAEPATVVATDQTNTNQYYFDCRIRSIYSQCIWQGGFVLCFSQV